MSDPLDALMVQHGATPAQAASTDLDALMSQHGASTEPTFRSSNAKDAQGNAVIDPNTVGTFAKHYASGINPLQAGQLLPFPKALGGSGMDHPLAVDGTQQYAPNFLKQMHAVKQEGDARWEKGDHVGAIAKYVESVIPLLGPMLSQQGNELQQGKYAAAGGDIGALITNVLLPKVLQNVNMKAPALPSGLNPDEAAAVQFGESRGIPVDAATATGNRFVKSVQAASEHTPLGAVVAERASNATSAALRRVAGELADEAHPTAVTPEQAGAGVRDSLRQGAVDLNALATDAYDRLREIEARPEHEHVVRTAPEGSPAYNRVLDRLKTGNETGTAPSRTELMVMRQIEAELDAQPYQRGRAVDYGSEFGSDVRYARGSANADVYHTIQQAAGSDSLTGVEMRNGISRTLETGEWNSASRAAYKVAQERLRVGEGSGSLTGPTLPPGTPILGSVERVQLPVDLRPAKSALRPLYNRLKREAELVPLQGDKGRALVALDRLMNGRDVESLSTVDAALGDLKAMARADIPELRTQGQGLAASAVKQLDRLVRQTAERAGPEALKALEQGRAATIGKYQVGDVLEGLRDEPVQAYRQAVAPKDSGIKQLRAMVGAAPEQAPRIARAYLEDLFGQAQAEGGFDKGARLWNDWQKLGTQTKEILFPQPGLRQSLDHFFLLVKRLQEPANSSKTALVGISSGLALALWHPTTGIPLNLAAGALAKMLHSRAGVQALTRGISVSLSSSRLPAAARLAAYADVVNAARAAGVDLSALPKAADQGSPQRRPQ